jgi:predicted ester cyclase
MAPRSHCRRHETKGEGATVDHSATMRNTYELIDAGDIDGFGDLLAADFVEHQGGPGYPPTKEGTLDFFRDLLVAFPDWHMAVQDLIAGRDKTVARVRVSGTQSGEFMGIPPTGMSADVELIDIMRFDTGGLVCEHWGVADMLSLMQQLGAIPAGAPA